MDTKPNVNPFYSGSRSLSSRPSEPSTTPTYVRLPRAPRTGSPVPRLTSLYHFDAADDAGDRRYPGNCGGALIRDLLLYFKPRNVFDPMTGSGTCADICGELGVPCHSTDIRDGFDATKADAFQSLADTPFDFVWAHPPYWREKLYTSHSGDLSRAPTLEAFLESYAAFIANCQSVLSRKGKLAILMGDCVDRQAGFIPLTYHTKQIAFALGFHQHCTDIIRFSHGMSSSTKTYSGSFIPNLHDTCMIFERA